MGFGGLGAVPQHFARRLRADGRHLSTSDEGDAERTAAGFCESPNGRKYPRLQLLTIEGLLDKTQRAEHPDYEPNTGYKKAKAERRAEQQKLIEVLGHA